MYSHVFHQVVVSDELSLTHGTFSSIPCYGRQLIWNFSCFPCQGPLWEVLTTHQCRYLLFNMQKGPLFDKDFTPSQCCCSPWSLVMVLGPCHNMPSSGNPLTPVHTLSLILRCQAHQGFTLGVWGMVMFPLGNHQLGTLEDGLEVITIGKHWKEKWPDKWPLKPVRIGKVTTNATTHYRWPLQVTIWRQKWSNKWLLLTSSIKMIGYIICGPQHLPCPSYGHALFCTPAWSWCLRQWSSWTTCRRQCTGPPHLPRSHIIVAVWGTVWRTKEGSNLCHQHCPPPQHCTGTSKLQTYSCKSTVLLFTI